MIKILLLTFLLCFTTVCGSSETPKSPVDKEHPFLKIGSSPDKTSSIYIGAFGNLLPTKTPAGDILLVALMKENIADEEYPEGYQEQYTILANCKNGVAKILIIWVKPDKNSPGISRYNAKDNNLGETIVRELNKQQLIKIENGSMLEIVVSSGCHYLGEKYVPSMVRLTPMSEWNI